MQFPNISWQEAMIGEEGIALRSVQASRNKTFMDVFAPALFGVLCAIVTSVLSLGLFSLVFSSRNVPQAAVMPIACVSIAIGAFAGGFAAARLLKSKGMLMGAVTGFLLFILLYVTGAAMHQINQGTLAFLKLVLALLAGSVGGIAGVNTKHGKHNK